MRTKLSLVVRAGSGLSDNRCTRPGYGSGDPAGVRSREQDGDVLSRVFDFPQPRARRSPSVTFHALQEWEGYVTEINDTEFTASLTDLTAGATFAGEEADIPLDEILEADAARMQVGSIFRWVIGYERTAGSKKRVSHIVFRDLPAITRTDLRDGEEWAHKIMAAFEQ